MSITQHEVVKQLGISRGTLHRVLAGSPLVKASTRERILKELEKLNYTPNIIAQGLKTRRTKTIGVVGPAAIRLANIDKLTSLHLSARNHGYSVILAYSSGSIEEDTQCIRELRSRMVDGLVVFGRGLSESAPLYESVIKSGLPMVTLYPVDGLETDCVYVDTVTAFRDLTRHLIRLGHKKIGLLVDSSGSQYTINRERGFREAMAQAKLPTNPDWIVRVSPDGTPSAGGAVMEPRLWQVSDYQLGFWGTSVLLSKRERPTALVCHSDEFAIGCLRACQLADVSVPGDLAITGYDDKEPAKFAQVPLTTMHQPDEKLGNEVIALLIERIEGNTLRKKPIVKTLSAELVIRESCGGARS